MAASAEPKLLCIRPAVRTDVPAVCKVLRRSIVELCEADHRNDPKFLANWLANKTPETISGWIENPDGVFYVAELDGRISGVAAMTRDGMITLLYVSPEARFQGLSKILLARLEVIAVEFGLAECRLESTRTASDFYHAAGYREQASCAVSSCGTSGNDCRPMIKRLRAAETSGSPSRPKMTLKEWLLTDWARADLQIPDRRKRRSRLP